MSMDDNIIGTTLIFSDRNRRKHPHGPGGDEERKKEDKYNYRNNCY
jgi:hypothetical protein